MIRTIPGWLIRHYCFLYSEYGTRSFTVSVLMERLSLSRRQVIAIVNRLQHAGWLTSTKDEIDKRRRNYVLLRPDDIVQDLGRQQSNLLVV